MFTPTAAAPGAAKLSTTGHVCNKWSTDTRGTSSSSSKDQRLREWAPLLCGIKYHVSLRPMPEGDSDAYRESNRHSAFYPDYLETGSQLCRWRKWAEVSLFVASFQQDSLLEITQQGDSLSRANNLHWDLVIKVLNTRPILSLFLRAHGC